MRKYYIFLLLVIGIILVGCAENPALIGLEEESRNSPEISEIKPETDGNKIEIKPPNVVVYAGDKSTFVALDVWCWEEESPCSLEPNPPKEQLYGNRPLSVEPGEVFKFILSTPSTEIPETDHIYSPDIIELVQIRLGEETEVEVNNNQITAPMEKGRYYYSMKLQWDGELVGQAYYAFSISVH